LTLVTAGRVGRPHGLDGSFHLEDPQHELRPGSVVQVASRDRRVVRRAGMDTRPLLALDGVADREAAAALRGELLLVETELDDDEWLAADLVGCEVSGRGTVRRVIAAPSCSLLELDGGELLPFVSDAVRSVDLKRRVIEPEPAFLADEQ
jgi:16S rRNA processing protein RimM